jgi:beta-mannosidase
MNFIRVWGGGIYETTHFYDLCDQMGLLVWQDFPFACAIYPFDGEFIANVKEEAIQNIKRLRNHPSLAIWVGNNEVEWLWSGLALNTKLIGKRIHNEFKKGYRTLFEEIFPEIIRKFDPATDYWPSSPSNGGGRIKPYHAAVSNLIRSNSPDKGDSHFWNVWHQSAPFTAYRKFFSRFMSEYGFESLPGMKTIKTFCSPDQMEFTSIIMENHQKNAAGNAKIMKYMKKRFIIPKEFEKQVLLSQITHGEALEYGIEHWRRHRANFHCMGSLYWQLNDCWPVASWASIDYCGRWKAAHYFVKRCYKPLYASVKETRRYMELWITNDLRSTQKGTISWTVLNSEGTIIFIEQHKFLIAPCSSKQIRSAKLSKVLKKPYHLKDKVIFFSLKKDSGDRTQHADQFGFRLFHSFKTFPLKEPNLTFEVITTSVIQKKTMDYYAIELAIKAQNVAFYNYLDLDDMDFVASDNFFGLMPNQKRKISIHVPKMQDKTELSLKTILKHLHVKSLYFLLNS